MTASRVCLPPIAALGFVISSAYLLLSGFSVWPAAVARGPWLWTAAGLWIAAVVLMPCFFSNRWLQSDGSGNWRRDCLLADAVLIFGFGFNKGSDGRPGAGVANEAMLNWTLAHTRAATLLVQEGAALAVQILRRSDEESIQRRFISVHALDGAAYVDTWQAACCAMEKMALLDIDKVLVVAHPHQLQRAAWVLAQLMQRHVDLGRVSVVIPELPAIPYPVDSAQWHTRSSWRFKLIELLAARPRDWMRVRLGRQC